MINYTVMTQEAAEAERFQLLKDGDYEAIIDDSVDKISQNSGNPMMEMTLSVYDENGKSYSVKDYLLFTSSTMWKTIQCAASANVMNEYNSNKFCSDIIRGRSVMVRVSIEKGSEIPIDKLKGKPHGSRYPDKNKIQCYLLRDNKKFNVPKQEDVPFNDDDLPF